MSLRSRKFRTVIGVLIVGLSTDSYGTDNVDSALHAQIGLVASINSSYYQGADEDYELLPLPIVEYKRFYVQGIDLGFHLYQGEDGKDLAVEIEGSFDGYESSDASILSGMAERKAAWEAALVYKAGIGHGQLKTKLMWDVSDRHQGFSTRIMYERPLWMDQTHLVSWYGGGEYWDRAKTNYYFGVKAFEASVNRPAYTAAESLNVFAGLNAIKQLSQTFSLLINAEYRLTSDAVAHSPLVDRNDQWSAYGGIFYSF